MSIQIIPVHMYYKPYSLEIMLLFKDILNTPDTRIFYDSDNKRTIKLSYPQKVYSLKEFISGLHYFDMNMDIKK